MEKPIPGLSKTSIIIICLISIVVSFLSIFFYDRFYVQKIAVFDLRGFIQEQQSLYLKGLINDDDFKYNMDVLEQYLNKVPKNRVIVMGDMVVKHNAEILPPPEGIRKVNIQFERNKKDILDSDRGKK